MNENKRLLIFFISIVLVVAVILVIAFWPEPDTTFSCGVTADKDYSKLGSVNYKQYECLMKEDNKFALAISDGLSDKEKEALNNAAEKLNVGIYYISDEVSNSDLKSVEEDLKNENVSYENALFVGDILSSGYFGAELCEIKKGDTVVFFVLDHEGRLSSRRWGDRKKKRKNFSEVLKRR